MEIAAYYDFYAERYGWTSATTDSEPEWLLQRYPVVAAVKRENVEAEQREAQRRADTQTAQQQGRR